MNEARNGMADQIVQDAPSIMGRIRHGIATCRPVYPSHKVTCSTDGRVAVWAPPGRLRKIKKLEAAAAANPEEKTKLLLQGLAVPEPKALRARGSCGGL